MQDAEFRKKPGHHQSFTQMKVSPRYHRLSTKSPNFNSMKQQFRNVGAKLSSNVGNTKSVSCRKGSTTHTYVEK